LSLPFLQNTMEEQFSAFLQAVTADVDLQEKLKAAASFDTFVVIARDAGFDVTKADFFRYHASDLTELRDEELDGAAGGGDTGFLGFWCSTAKGIC